MEKIKNKSISNKLIIFFIIISCFQVLTCYALPVLETDIKYDITVSNNGNFTSIQEAIDTAQNNDIIFIKNGTYYENIVIDKSIKLIGSNKTKTIIDGRKAGNVIKINADNITILNLTIQHSGSYFPNAGINLSSSNVTIENTILKRNLYGIILYNSQNNNIQNNMIQDNYNCGIYLSNSTNNYFSNNIIINHTFNGFGIYDKSNYNIIKNNTFIQNGYCAINIRSSTNNKINFNNITNNNIGIHIPSTENNISQNNFSNNNKNYDKEFLTPGFEFLLFIISFTLLLVYYNKIDSKP